MSDKLGKGDSFDKESVVNNVKSKGKLCKIRTKKCAVIGAFNQLGASDESSLYVSEGEESHLSDFEYKWLLRQNRWQLLGTFQRAHIGRNQRKASIVKEYVGFKEGVASASFNASRKNQVGGAIEDRKAKPLEYWLFSQFYSSNFVTYQ